MLFKKGKFHKAIVIIVLILFPHQYQDQSAPSYWSQKKSDTDENQLWNSFWVSEGVLASGTCSLLFITATRVSPLLLGGGDWGILQLALVSQEGMQEGFIREL